MIGASRAEFLIAIGGEVSLLLVFEHQSFLVGLADLSDGV